MDDTWMQENTSSQHMWFCRPIVLSLERKSREKTVLDEYFLYPSKFIIFKPKKNKLVIDTYCSSTSLHICQLSRRNSAFWQRQSPLNHPGVSNVAHVYGCFYFAWRTVNKVLHRKMLTVNSELDGRRSAGTRGIVVYFAVFGIVFLWCCG